MRKAYVLPAQSGRRDFCGVARVNDREKFKNLSDKSRDVLLSETSCLELYRLEMECPHTDIRNLKQNAHFERASLLHMVQHFQRY